MSTKNPQPCGKSPRWIISAAHMLATQMEFERGGDIVGLVTRLGGTVTVVEPHEIEGGVACITVPGNGKSFEIKVAKHTFPLQRRYAIAHDLAHYVLHSAFGDRSICACASPLNAAGELIEYEAHLFASALLMPEDEMKTLPFPITSEVAAHFQVPLHVAGGWIECLNELSMNELSLNELSLNELSIDKAKLENATQCCTEASS